MSTEKEKEQKAFSQCADAVSALDKKSVIKVLHMLSILHEVMPSNLPAGPPTPQSNMDDLKNEATRQLATIASDSSSGGSSETNTADKKRAAKQRPAPKDPIWLTDLDLKPDGKASLKDFVAKYNASNYFERNLVYAQYLHEVLGMQVVTMDQLFTCYKHFGGKLPLFPATIHDTKRNRGWLEYNDMSTIKVTRKGLNDLLDLLIPLKAAENA